MEEAGYWREDFKGISEGRRGCERKDESEKQEKKERGAWGGGGRFCINT